MCSLIVSSTLMSSTNLFLLKFTKAKALEWGSTYLTDSMHITENYWRTLKCQQKDFYCICRQNGYIFNVYIFSHFMIFSSI